MEAMAVSESYLEFVREQLAPVGNVVIRKMFGGAGVYCDGAMFGLVLDETLHFRGDAASQARFQAAGCQRFIHERPPRKPMAMPYWVVPENLVEDQDEMSVWARDAIEIREKQAKGAKAARRKPKATKAARDGKRN
jgi:DNA transformation protein and related proteins